MTLKRFIEYYFALPIRWLLLRDITQQTCKRCGQADGYDFHVQEDVWNAVVPEAFRNRVLCLRCFAHYAREKGVDARPHVEHFGFCAW